MSRPVGIDSSFGDIRRLESTYTVRVTHNLNPRPRWALWWRPWSAFITVGLMHLGEPGWGPGRSADFQNLIARCGHHCRKDLLSKGIPVEEMIFTVTGDLP